MLWAIEPLRRSGLRKLNPTDADYLRYGFVYFGRLRAFSFECPGCAELREIGTDEVDKRGFDQRSQAFRCDCGLELHLSILAEASPMLRYPSTMHRAFAERGTVTAAAVLAKIDPGS